jgi:hypothetical protein
MMTSNYCILVSIFPTFLIYKNPYFLKISETKIHSTLRYAFIVICKINSVCFSVVVKYSDRKLAFVVVEFSEHPAQET